MPNIFDMERDFHRPGRERRRERREERRERRKARRSVRVKGLGPGPGLYGFKDGGIVRHDTIYDMEKN
jgi:hypothetical protein